MRTGGKIIKELKSHRSEKDNAGVNPSEPVRLMPHRRKPPSLVVVSRQQTPEEQRQCNAALDAFLTEWVRQHLGPQS